MVIAQPAALHILTPGSPAYALAKVGALGSLVALRVVLARRERRRREGPAETDVPDAAPARRQPHPVSRKKRKRRRRG
jgi:hypothetical protein